MKVLIFGDSHTGALSYGKKQLESAGDFPPDINMTIRPLGGGHLLPTPFFIDRGDHAEIIEPTYRKQFKRLPMSEKPDDDLIYGICAPLHTMRVHRHPDWNRFAQFDVAVGEAPVSSLLIEKVVLDDQKYTLALIDILLRVDKRVFVVEPPRLFRHINLLNKIRKEVLISNDNKYREIIRKKLEERSVPVVSVPNECVDDQGFMLDKFRHEKDADQHHGNKQFGELMMREVIKFLRKV